MLTIHSRDRKSSKKCQRNISKDCHFELAQGRTSVRSRESTHRDFVPVNYNIRTRRDHRPGKFKVIGMDCRLIGRKESVPRERCVIGFPLAQVAKCFANCFKKLAQEETLVRDSRTAMPECANSP